MNEKSKRIAIPEQARIGVCTLGNNEPLVCNSKAAIVQFDVAEKPIPKTRVVLCNYGGKASCRFRKISTIEIT